MPESSRGIMSFVHAEAVDVEGGLLASEVSRHGSMSILMERMIGLVGSHGSP